MNTFISILSVNDFYIEVDMNLAPDLSLVKEKPE